MAWILTKRWHWERLLSELSEFNSRQLIAPAEFVINYGSDNINSLEDIGDNDTDDCEQEEQHEGLERRVTENGILGSCSPLRTNRPRGIYRIMSSRKINFFTSFSLLGYVDNNNIQATGVIRSNKLGKCFVESQKTLDKKTRGYDQRTDVNGVLTVVGWNDNRSVYVS